MPYHGGNTNNSNFLAGPHPPTSSLLLLSLRVCRCSWLLHHRSNAVQVMLPVIFVCSSHSDNYHRSSCRRCWCVHSSRPGTVGIPRRRKLWRKMCSNRRNHRRTADRPTSMTGDASPCQLLCGPSVETHPIGGSVRSGLVFQETLPRFGIKCRGQSYENRRGFAEVCVVDEMHGRRYRWNRTSGTTDISRAGRRITRAVAWEVKFNQVKEAAGSGQLAAEAFTSSWCEITDPAIAETLGKIN